MKKADAVSALERHLKNGVFRTRGEKAFTQFFRWWLSRLDIPHDKKYDFWEIDQHLPQLAVDAWEDMRTGTNKTTTNFREEYEIAVGRPMVGLLELEEDSDSRFLQMSMICDVVETILPEEWLRNKIESYCGAQAVALQGKFDQFLRLVYRKGLFDIIMASGSKSMRGGFGSTELRTCVMMGRTFFTFARPKKKGTEVSVNFQAVDDDDPLALHANVLSAHANLATGLSMIEDVISRWPKTAKAQVQIYHDH